MASEPVSGSGFQGFGAASDVQTARRSVVPWPGELDEGAAALRQFDEMKSTFITLVSHELRTPMTVISGYLSLLAKKGSTLSAERREEMIAAAARRAEELRSIIIELTAFTDLNARRGPGSVFSQAPEGASVSELVDQIAERLGPLAFDRGIALHRVVDDRVGGFPDPVRLQLVLEHLWTNAIKFGREGGFARLAITALDQAILIEVSDNGPGMDPAVQRAIFLPFQQLEPLPTRRHGGLGLGLAIVRMAVDDLGGTLELESAPCWGTVIRVHLPYGGRAAMEQGMLTAPAGSVGTEHDSAQAVRALATAIAARDDPAGGHIQRVAALAKALGQQLGLQGESLEHLELIAILHDLGKIQTPDAILSKPEALDEGEQATMRQHAAEGGALAARIDFLAPLGGAIRAHHERYDGQGYPDGLAGDAIPLAARIVAVVDCFDVMTHDRPYREKRSAPYALAELRRCAGSQFDPAIVAAFLDLWEAGRFEALRSSLLLVHGH